MTTTEALSGLRVITYSPGISLVGAGIAAQLPGSFFRDFGAEVVVVEANSSSTLDRGVEWHRPWNRGKGTVRVDDDRGSHSVRRMAEEADVLVLAGPEALIEREGLNYPDLREANPRLVVVRIRPSRDRNGLIPDVELLVHARTGLLTQFRGHAPGPTFCPLPIAGIGAGLGATAGALARLYEREATGTGGWVETSLYDGMLAMLGLVVGRVQHPSTSTERLWSAVGSGPAMTYRCADGKFLQLWFGTPRGYDDFLSSMGDTPSDGGYMHELQTGRVRARSQEWETQFATRDEAWWMERFAGKSFSCVPVLRPGEVLRDPHLRAVGLRVDYDDPVFGASHAVGPVGEVTPIPPSQVWTPAGGLPAEEPGGSPVARTGLSPLSGVRVLDMSAYLAGPVAALVFAELGAEVIKVEPVSGDAHRGVEPMFAAGQRGKRALALDLKSPDVEPVLRRLFEWSDVVHHNARVGLAERLRYDEATVRALNPTVIYSHASGFGPRGPRARTPANDHLMQALSGIEAEAGGDGQPPTSFSDWAAVDIVGGWLSASAVLAALYARRRTGRGQSVWTSLLGAGMTMRSGAFLAGDELVEGPRIDPGQRGYGAAYRIYQCQDGRWLALAIPDGDSWARLGRVVGPETLGPGPPPLRAEPGERQAAEVSLEEVFARKGAALWAEILRAAGVPAEMVRQPTRAEFIADIFDDPVSRQLGRVVSFPWGDRGLLEQAASPIRLGPQPPVPADAHLPTIGEHSHAVLESLGFDRDERAALAESGTIAGPA